ncbi:MAG: zinc-ribbon domain-containing protein [Geobacteraceae bacterium]
MGMLTISCPSCGFSRQMPSEKVPEGPRRVTCPQCKEIFIYDKSAAPVAGDGVPEPTTSEASLFTETSQPDAHSASGDHVQRPVAEAFSGGGHEEPPGSPAATEMTDIGELFRQSWELYQKRFATLILLYFLTMLAMIIPTAVATGLAFFVTLLTGGITFFVTVCLGAVIGVACSLWCYGGLLCAVLDENLGLEDALARGKTLILPLAWVFLLGGFIIAGGYFLLLIPGVIFTVWFCLAQFIMPGENVRGMAALLKSREYVRGHWLDVALRLFLVWIVSGFVSSIPVFGLILAVLFFPYLMIFHYLIYRDLRAIKGDISCTCGTKSKFLWPGVALIGWIVVPVMLFLLFGSLFCQKLHQGKGTLVRLETTRSLSHSG